MTLSQKSGGMNEEKISISVYLFKEKPIHRSYTVRHVWRFRAALFLCATVLARGI
jgi:hypothetical protein